MKQQHKKIIKCLIALLTITAITKVSYELKWLDLLWGIFKVETKPHKVQRVSLKTLAYIAPIASEAEFLVEMSELGWHFIKHYGRGMIFEKDGYEILITKREYFNRYAFYEVTTKEVFDVI